MTRSLNNNFSLFVLVSFLFWTIPGAGQIAFEEITPPEDFNIGGIWKSPVGEYFVQTVNDSRSIYSSLDGETWIKRELPFSMPAYEFQFLNDGTPILQTERSEHVIRRNGSWHLMVFGSGGGNVQASFAKEDTLFVFKDEAFGYSLDQGETFQDFFEYGDIIFDHTASLFVFDSHLILHHTAGASDHLSVFSRQGERLFYSELDLGLFQILSNPTCGELLFYDNNNYYMYLDESLHLIYGVMDELIPDFTGSHALLSVGGKYFYRYRDKLYRSGDCNFEWEEMLSDSLLWLEDQILMPGIDEILVYNIFSDRFYLKGPGENVFAERAIGIHHPYVLETDQSQDGREFVLSTNALFTKLPSDTEWTEIEVSLTPDVQWQLSPSGDIYLLRESVLLVSFDNGESFSNIDLPDEIYAGDIRFLKLHILDDNTIFLLGNIITGGSYYSLNNGQDWISVDLPGGFLDSRYALAKKVENAILVVIPDFTMDIYRIDLTSNSIFSETLDQQFFGVSRKSVLIMDDGTIYFNIDPLFDPIPGGFHRYVFGEGITYIGDFPELGTAQLIGTSGFDIFGFLTQKYYNVDGTQLLEYSYEGENLPGLDVFHLARSEFLYAISDRNRIFRSTLALAYDQFISGSVFHDMETVCEPDSAENTLSGWSVRLEGANYLRIRSTDQNGSFHFSVPEGSYSISTQPVNPHWELCDQAFQLSVDEVNPNAIQNFRAKVLNDCSNLELDFSTPRLRRCFENTYAFSVRNSGPGTSSGTFLELTLDPYFDIVSASLPYEQVSIHTIQFDLGQIDVGEKLRLQVTVYLSCDAGLGQEHCMLGQLSDVNLCQGLEAAYMECQTNIGSYDPNDKRVFNASGIRSGTVEKGEYISYHVRFQNTGTDTAFSVKVIDTLSPRLDLNTLEMLSASHPYSYEITEGPQLIVRFDNILLPDSTTNEPASHGYFKFRIKPKVHFDYGTQIGNEASIYFDFNEPIATNLATVIIQKASATQNLEDLGEVTLFPNPASGILEVQLERGEYPRVSQYSVVNMLGRIEKQDVFDRDSRKIRIRDLPPGVYYLLLQNGGETLRLKKFVKH